jgi:hypothetical protein
MFIWPIGHYKVPLLLKILVSNALTLAQVENYKSRSVVLNRGAAALSDAHKTSRGFANF